MHMNHYRSVHTPTLMMDYKTLNFEHVKTEYVDPMIRFTFIMEVMDNYKAKRIHTPRYNTTTHLCGLSDD